MRDTVLKKILASCSDENKNPIHTSKCGYTHPGASILSYLAHYVLVFSPRTAVKRL